jgi:hypothetical protein
MGYAPQSAFYVYLVLTIVLQIVRVLFVCHYVHLSIRDVLFQIILRPGICILLAAIPPIFIHVYFEPGIVSTIIVLVTSIIANLIFIGSIGFTTEERKSVLSLVSSKISKKKH